MKRLFSRSKGDKGKEENKKRIAEKVVTQTCEIIESEVIEKSVSKQSMKSSMDKDSSKKQSKKSSDDSSKKQSMKTSDDTDKKPSMKLSDDADKKPSMKSPVSKDSSKKQSSKTSMDKSSNDKSSNTTTQEQADVVFVEPTTTESTTPNTSKITFEQPPPKVSHKACSSDDETSGIVWNEDFVDEEEQEDSELDNDCEESSDDLPKVVRSPMASTINDDMVLSTMISQGMKARTKPKTKTSKSKRMTTLIKLIDFVAEYVKSKVKDATVVGCLLRTSIPANCIADVIMLAAVYTRSSENNKLQHSLKFTPEEISSVASFNPHKVKLTTRQNENLAKSLKNSGETLNREVFIRTKSMNKKKFRGASYYDLWYWRVGTVAPGYR